MLGMAVRLTPGQCERLRRVRKRARLTQAALAERLGVTSQHVNMIESGKKAASLNVLQRLGSELGLDITVKTLVSIKRKSRG
jgi:transcriptional regulator with XRE-family HTH domain